VTQVEVRPQATPDAAGSTTTPGRRLAVLTKRRLAFGLSTATVDGALTVFVFLEFIMPPPSHQHGDQGTAKLVNLFVFIAYLIVSIYAGTRWSSVRMRPIYDWLTGGGPAGPAERRDVVRVAREQAILGFFAWEIAAIVFGIVNLPFSTEVAWNVGGTIALAGLSMSALTYLITERIMRPVVARAIDAGEPERPSGIGVLPRILLTWAFCTGIPLLGIALAYVGQPRSALPGLVAPTYFLVAVGLATGLMGMVIAAKSVSEPLSQVRSAMAAVGDGDTSVGVRVDDASEIGQLQAGFNRMVVGLRERQQLADLFGRHVGVEVARAALERGVELGGETHEAAVLFVDIVGSTALAAERPAEEIVERLNSFFGVVVDVVERYGGWVNKFEGDAALCVFGVPIGRPNPAEAALGAARTLRERLTGLPDLDVGIGVACGPVVAGNVGAEARYEYTVIGDPVNEASRLSDLAKTSPQRLYASGAALAAAGEREAAKWRLDGEETLRGRSVPTRLAVPA
jgi:adenylate cyclase